jgi:hypothetical protein
MYYHVMLHHLSGNDRMITNVICNVINMFNGIEIPLIYITNI